MQVDIHYELLALVDGVSSLPEFGQGVGNQIRKLPTKYHNKDWYWLINAFEERCKARHINQFMQKLYKFCTDNEIELKLFDPRKERQSC